MKLISIEDMARTIPRLPVSGPRRMEALRAAFSGQPAPAALGVRQRPGHVRVVSPEERAETARHLSAETQPRELTTLRPLPPLTAKEAKKIPTEALFFDRAWYLQTYPDVAHSGMEPAQHFRENGEREGRNPNPHFNSRLYLAANPDVALTGLGPFEHFIYFGFAERRRLTPAE